MTPFWGPHAALALGSPRCVTGGQGVRAVSQPVLSAQAHKLVPWPLEPLAVAGKQAFVGNS